MFDAPTTDPRALGRRAFVWGYPLVRAAQLRFNITRPLAPDEPGHLAVARAPLNTLGHARMLSSPETRIGVAPNNDTLYSLAWLDLSGEPFVLESPDFGARYYTFQMGQADTSTDRSLGQRTHGSALPPVWITGPDWHGEVPVGMEHVRSHHRHLMVAGRILVDGPADLPAVHALQDRIRLHPWTQWTTGSAMLPSAAHVPSPMGSSPGRSAPSELAFLQQLGAVLPDLTLATRERSLVESLKPIGMDRSAGFQQDALGSAQRAEVLAGLQEGEALVRAKTHDLGRKVNGWSINDRGPRFGDDDLLRAAVAMDQIYIVEPEEALYPSARVDVHGEPLDGHRRYRIRFGPDGAPPVGAFWSITVYFAQGFMAPNAIDRWAIGDRTPGLVRSADGALELLLQHDTPSDWRTANWLPVPRAPFMLLMRLYHPRGDILAGRWVPPPVVPID